MPPKIVETEEKINNPDSVFQSLLIRRKGPWDLRAKTWK